MPLINNLFYPYLCKNMTILHNTSFLTLLPTFQVRLGGPVLLHHSVKPGRQDETAVERQTM